MVTGLSPSNSENMENILPISSNEQSRGVEGQSIVEAVSQPIDTTANQPSEDSVQTFHEETAYSRCRYETRYTRITVKSNLGTKLAKMDG